jgi:hypothetical protein
MSQAGVINIAGGGGAGSPVQTLTGNTGGAVPPTGNNINIVGGIGATVVGTPGTSTLTINVVSDGFKWSEISVPTAASVQNGYFCNLGLTITLPTTDGPPVLAIGNSIIVYADTPSPVIIQTSPGQFIQVGNDISAAGGTSTSKAQGCILEIV